ncbi:sensor histidine kinase [Oceanispirochaeta sp.]|jgi:ligand-binding sensor domain-containing protein/signal transduction histidine kinase|uniref:sensor histidine kinase n=1 Tax=Oceanispirochaeta sp. TaxID=2035350 RepID=UPI002634B61F|nr:sensor histidine kinase [Oceanispirochaeta sp.]MDA3955291.1 histidine kinase [Oceanispirochaeta sp.]
MKVLFLILMQTLLILPSFLWGEEFRFSSLTMEDGLSSNSVYCITRDSSGYLWFGTFSGLNRYDGQKITTFRPRTGTPDSISGSVIFAILEDRKQNIWVGTDGGGLNLFNRETLGFSHFRNDPKDPFSIPGNQIFALEEGQDGRLWIGTAGGGLAFYRGEGRFFILNEKNSRLMNNRIRTLYNDHQNRLWIGTEKGLSVYNTKSGDFEKEDSIKGWNLLNNLFIRTIIPDEKNGLWIGTNSGLFLYKDKEIRAFPLPEKTAIRSITSDGNRLWVGTERSGIFLYNYESEFWTHLQEEPGGLSYNKIRSLYRDPDGLILVGTRGGGVNIFNPASTQITNYLNDGDPGYNLKKKSQIRQMVERSDGSLWVATDGGGISVIDRNSGRISWKDVNAADIDSENDQVYSLLEDSRGNFWIGTDGAGLYTIPPGGMIDQARPVPLPWGEDQNSYTETIWVLLEDYEGSLWIGTEGKGLYRLKEGEWTQFKHEPGEPGHLNGNAVRSIFEDSKHQLWVGTWDGGLNLYQKESNSFKSFVRSPSRTESLSDNSVNVIFEDSLHRLWIGTAGGGINIFQPEGMIFRTITSREGLSGDNIYGILEDDTKNIWVSTDKGHSRITPVEEHILNFSEADGLAGNEFSQNAYLKTKDGTLFWGGPRGISSFHPEQLIRKQTALADIMITGLSVHNLPIRIGQEMDGLIILDKDISLKEKVTLPFSANNLTIQFSILSYIDPGKHHFSVQLKGLEERPRFLGNRNEVSYASVPPGLYELVIFGSDHNGQNSRKSLAIQILTPFWMNLWFYLVSGILATLIISLFVWLRLRDLKKSNDQLRNFSMHMEQAREEERKAAAREYHDELGQQLTAMKFDLFWLNSHPEAEGTIRTEKISSLLEIVNDSIGSVRSISTSLRPKALDNLSLKEALEWQSRRFRKRTGIPLSLQINLKGKIFPESEIERKTAIFRMYQEILTNIIRHTAASQVNVKVFMENNAFCMIVHDNGTGIKRQSKTRIDAFGLIGMRERCRHLNGSFFIDNHPEGGTMVRIILPVKDANHA